MARGECRVCGGRTIYNRTLCCIHNNGCYKNRQNSPENIKKNLELEAIAKEKSAQKSKEFENNNPRHIYICEGFWRISGVAGIRGSHHTDSIIPIVCSRKDFRSYMRLINHKVVIPDEFKQQFIEAHGILTDEELSIPKNRNYHFLSDAFSV